MKRRAFTLLEMTVVIAVTAILAHLAVRELGGRLDAKRGEAADRQLEEIRLAAADFLDDVGRLPRLTAETNRDGKVTWTLSELWRRPPYLNERSLLEKDGVKVAVGWAGPYLEMPFGRDRLLDPWGNPLELEDSAGLRRLWADERLVVTNICHYGPTGQAPARKDLSLVPEGGERGTLALVVDAGGYAGEVSCAWYAPYGNSVTNSDAVTAVAGQAVFEDVPCGKRLVRIVAADVTVRMVEVKGGVNQVQLKVR